MKKIKKSLVAAAALATIGTGGIIGMQAVNAESATTTDPMSSLVDKLVSKFDLNKEDVQKVFDESRTEMEAKREAEQATRLQALVDNKTITSEQKTKIEAKIKEMKAERESSKDSMKDLTEAERKAKMDEKRAELEAWAKEIGLDLSKLQGVLMRGGPGSLGGPRGERPTDTTTQ